MIKSRIAVLVLIAVSNIAVAVDAIPKDVVEPRRLGEQLMKFAVADDMAGLFKHMGTMSPMDRSQLEKFRDDIVAQRKAIGSKLGAPVGFAFVSECRRGDFLSRVIFAEKRAKSPMRWQFIFYKGREKWQVVNFYWDDKLPEFFESCT